MKKYEQIVWKYLKGNKKRTISTMFGVAFGALLIFAVINMTFCMIRSGILYAEEVFNFDAVFYEVPEDQVDVIKNYPGVEAVYGGSIHPFVFENTHMVLVDDFSNSPYNIHLQEGAYPQNSHEIIMDANEFEMYGYEIGETINFSPGIRPHTEEEMEFVISGTFVLKEEGVYISSYKYSWISYIGLMQDDSYQQLKDTNAVYVKYKNPYRIKGLTKEISERIGAEYIINDSIAMFYNQTSDGSSQAVTAAIVLFIVVMIALMSIAVIKNTLRISVAERMKDYGVLRCAGASLKQLKKMLIEEALIIGGISGLAGIFVSYIVILIFTRTIKIYDFSHFFILAMILTLVIIEITMLLATIDPCKLLEKLTPVEAVRNQVKTNKNEIYKVRKAKLITKVFGIEGAYAYKNAMRSPKQFVTKVLALMIGIIIFFCTETICETYMHIVLAETEIDKYYNIVSEMSIEYEYGHIEPDPEVRRNIDLAVRELQELEDIGNSVGTYIVPDSSYYMEGYRFEKTDPLEFYTEEFKASYRNDGNIYSISYPEDDSDAQAMEKYATFSQLRTTRIFAYDKNLLSKLSDTLIAGTCDPEELGPDDIILCNTFTDYKYNAETDMDEPYVIEVFDYEIGDQISFVTAPYEEFERRLQEKEAIFLEQHRGEVSDEEWQEWGYESEEEYIKYDYWHWIRFEVCRDLYEEGYYKTYTIKGIISEDMLISSLSWYSYGEHYILSKDQMQELFPGYEKKFLPGIGMHIEGYNEDVIEILDKYNLYSEYDNIMLEYEIANNTRRVCDAVLLIVLLFMMINIFNTTASSMVFRKQEFALLRCVGMSKKKLSYMILLESVLALIIALFFGGLISCACGYGMYRYMRAFLGDFTVVIVPFARVMTAIFLLFVIMMLAAWIPLQSIKKEIAPSLAETDE